MSRRERDMVESHVETILEHLVKLELSPAERPRRSCLVTVDEQRAKLARQLTTTLRKHLETELSARKHLETELSALYTGLRRPVARQLEKGGVQPNVLPPVCPYTLDELLDPDWYPDNAHGLSAAKP